MGTINRAPREDAPATEKEAFHTRFFNPRAVGRVGEMQQKVLNLHYTYGRQWLTLDRDRLDPSGRGFVYRSLTNTAEDSRAMPVTNEVLPAVDVEVSALVKRQWTPKVVTSSKDPRVEAAARENDRILTSILERNNWEATRDEFVSTSVITGFGALLTYVDETYTKPTMVLSPEAVRCESCQLLLASTRVSGIDAGKYMGAPVRPIENSEELELTHCPVCSQKPLMFDDDGNGQAASGTLLPFDEPIDDDLSDHFGRPMRVETPYASATITEVQPWHFYPDNSGITFNLSKPRAFGVRMPMHISDVENRFPQLRGKLSPLPQTTMLDEHPLLGDWDYVGRFDSSYDSNAYDSHCFVDHYCEQPSVEHPDGRYIVYVVHGNGVEVQDYGALIITKDIPYVVTGERMQRRVERMKVHPVNWMRRKGSIWGIGIVDNMVSIQNRINAIDGQVAEARERTGDPSWLIPPGMSIEGPETRESGVGKFYHVEGDPTNPQFSTPIPFGSTLFPSGHDQERTNALTSLARVGGPQEIEVGQAPTGVYTTSGLQVLGENTDRRRAPRERPLIAATAAACTHLLELESIFRVEQAEYDFETKDGSWDRAVYDRTHILPGVQVRIEMQAHIYRSIWEREAAREAQADGLYDISSPLARKRLLELRSLPTDINDDTNRQIDLAKRQWVSFHDDQTIPAINTSLDDPNLRFLTLRDQLLSDEGQLLLEQSNWNAIFQRLDGWEEELSKVQAARQMQLSLYPAVMSEQEKAEHYAFLVAQWDIQKQEYETLKGQADLMPAGSVPPPQLPPPPPPAPTAIPGAIELQIHSIWTKMLPEGTVDDSILRFMAVVEGYRLLSAPPPMPPDAANQGAQPTAPLPLGGAQGG